MAAALLHEIPPAGAGPSSRPSQLPYCRHALIPHDPLQVLGPLQAIIDGDRKWQDHADKGHAHPGSPGRQKSISSSAAAIRHSPLTLAELSPSETVYRSGDTALMLMEHADAGDLLGRQRSQGWSLGPLPQGLGGLGSHGGAGWAVVAPGPTVCLLPEGGRRAACAFCDVRVRRVHVVDFWGTYLCEVTAQQMWRLHHTNWTRQSPLCCFQPVSFCSLFSFFGPLSGLHAPHCATYKV